MTLMSASTYLRRFDCDVLRMSDGMGLLSYDDVNLIALVTQRRRSQ